MKKPCGKFSLPNRMKSFYEKTVGQALLRKVPVAIRIDGKAFHTFTRGFDKPFDMILMKAMQETAKYLCENIQGCVFGYTESDEITLILIDYKKLTSAAWFDYKIQKLASTSASMATMYFNKIFTKLVNEAYGKYLAENDQNPESMEKMNKLFDAYYRSIEAGAIFDSRCFNIPKEEVTNLVYWRQTDATRNSIQAVGQAHYSQNLMNSKTNNEIQEMLFTDFGINWNDFPVPCKRGTAIVKNLFTTTSLPDGTSIGFLRDTTKPEHVWIIDENMPILTGENRTYLDNFVIF